MVAKNFGNLPTDQVQMWLSKIADVLLTHSPRTRKDEFVRAMENAISDWFAKEGGPGMILATHWGVTDARIRTAMIDEGCTTLEQLALKSDAELLMLPNFGHGSLRRLREITTGKRHLPAWRGGIPLKVVE